MKPFPVLSASVALGLAACNSFNAPLSSSGFDPLLPPGAGGRVQPGQPSIKAGDLVRAIMDNTFFFKQLPKGEADADKTLLRGTGMKVVRVAGSYLQVELDVTGEVGYVPSIMVESASAAPGQAPPLPTGPGDMNPLPPLDPATQPPGGAIPLIIDPNATPAPATGTPPAPPPAPPPTPTGPGTDPVPPLEPKVVAPVPPKPVAPAEKPAAEAPTGQ